MYNKYINLSNTNMEKHTGLNDWYAAEQQKWDDLSPDEAKQREYDQRRHRAVRIGQDAARLAARFDDPSGYRISEYWPPRSESSIDTDTVPLPIDTAPSPTIERDAERTPLTTEQAEQLLSYTDVLDDPSVALDYVRTNENAISYAKELVSLSENYGQIALVTFLDRVRSQYTAAVDHLGIDTSKYGKSITWPLWDLAKQSYLAKHPEQSSPEYTLVDLFDPAHQAEKITEISNRHLGYEFAQQYEQDHGVLDKAPRSERQKIKDLLANTPRNKSGQLPSWQLARLGELLNS